MLWRAVVVLGGGGYIAYRVALATAILRARRAGDVVREQRLRTRGFGLHRWVVGVLLVLFLVLLLATWVNTR
jgi:hypothetical protein